jgi:hypothetical protein
VVAAGAAVASVAAGAEAVGRGEVGGDHRRFPVHS